MNVAAEIITTLAAALSAVTCRGAGTQTVRNASVGERRAAASRDTVRR